MMSHVPGGVHISYPRHTDSERRSESALGACTAKVSKVRSPGRATSRMHSRGTPRVLHPVLSRSVGGDCLRGSARMPPRRIDPGDPGSSQEGCGVCVMPILCARSAPEQNSLCAGKCAKFAVLEGQRAKSRGGSQRAKFPSRADPYYPPMTRKACTLPICNFCRVEC